MKMLGEFVSRLELGSHQCSDDTQLYTIGTLASDGHPESVLECGKWKFTAWQCFFCVVAVVMKSTYCQLEFMPIPGYEESAVTFLQPQLLML